MTVSESVSKRISLMSLISAFLVVFIHMPMARDSGWTNWVQRFIGCGLSSVAVPFFFIASGFFLGNHIRENHWHERAVKKRFYTLFIPYCLWCMLLGVYMNVFPLLANIIHQQPLMRNLVVDPTRIFGIDPRCNPPCPLWYLRELILIVLISPLLAYFVKGRKIIAQIVLALLFFGSSFQLLYVSGELKEMFVYTFSMINVFWFCLGMYISVNPVLVPKKIGRSCFMIGILMFICSTAFSRSFDGEWHVFKYLYRYSAIALTLVGLWSLCPSKELPSFLKGQSFPIYLLHALCIPFVLMLKDYFPRVMLSLPGYFTSAAVVVAWCIVVNLVLRKYYPKAHSVIFGGR